jgi:GTP-binding protein of the ras superfamily involved in termination of M-phase
MRRRIGQSIAHYRPMVVSLYVDQDFWPSSVVIKVGMVGDSQIGKTSLMVKYVEGSFDEVWIYPSFSRHFLCSPRFPRVYRTTFRLLVRSQSSAQSMENTFDVFITSGVNFMEKTISVRRTTITFSIWDLGG